MLEDLQNAEQFMLNEIKQVGSPTSTSYKKTQFKSNPEAMEKLTKKIDKVIIHRVSHPHPAIKENEQVASASQIAQQERIS